MRILSPWLLAPGLGMVLVGVLGAFIATRASRALWRPLAIGAGAWAVAVLMKLIWALPTNAIVHRILLGMAGQSIGSALDWIYIGLLTGIFECGITALIVARTNLRDADWSRSLAFGTGFGVTEAVVLGLLSLVGTATLLLTHNLLPQATQTRVAAQLAGHVAFLPLMMPIVERVVALFTHIFSCVAIIFGFRTRRVLLWFSLAFVYKSAVDSVAAWGIEVLKARESVTGLLQLESLLIPFAVVGLVGLVYLHRRERPGTPVQL